MSDSAPVQDDLDPRRGKRPKKWRSSGAYHLENVEKPQRLSQEHLEAAQRATAGLAADAEDAALLLRMLGIHPDNVELDLEHDIDLDIEFDNDKGMTA